MKEEEEKSVRERLAPSVSSKVEVTRLSLTQAAMIVIVAMKKEKGWLYTGTNIMIIVS